MREFQGTVFDELFKSDEYRKLLIKRIVTMQVDERLLKMLLECYAGRPPLPST